MSNDSDAIRSAAQSLTRLMEGNQRYVEARALHPGQDLPRRAALTAGQAPFATILGCSDSRVPPQLIFDQGLGDLFTTRVAGNITDDAVIASIEYSITALGVPLVVILGHTGCGAVRATIEHSQKGKPLPGHLQGLVHRIEPALAVARPVPGDLEENTICANVQLVTEQLSSEPVIEAAVIEGRMALIGAVYDLESGRVNINSAIGLNVPEAFIGPSPRCHSSLCR